MTALDIVTAYSVIPGREDVALFLGEAMRGEGWQDNKLSLKRQTLNEKLKHSERRQADRMAIQRILNLDGQWWGQNDDDLSEEPSEDEKDIEDVEFYVCNISSLLSRRAYANSSRHHHWIILPCSSSLLRPSLVCSIP